jgi:hypothetical protein
LNFSYFQAKIVFYEEDDGDKDDEESVSGDSSTSASTDDDDDAPENLLSHLHVSSTPAAGLADLGRSADLQSFRADLPDNQDPPAFSPRYVLGLFAGVSDPLCLSSFSALHFFR